ncbi:antibiotic biosynthesis monooxygenase [bacterium]|nr:antibiotic biosynthesis monooxygenase [bacterium]
MMLFMLKILPSPANRRELLGILRGVVGPTAIQPGCLACAIYEGSGEDQTVLYLEHWESLASIERHIQSTHYHKILAAMELSTVQPEICFYETSRIWGMELLDPSRTPAGGH